MTDQTIPEEKLTAFLEAAHRAAGYGLVRHSSGNLSCRVDRGRVMISARGAWLETLAPEQVALCDLETGECLNGREPSTERLAHFGALRARSDIDAVLHFQSPYATAVACGDPAAQDFFIIPEIPYYIGDVAVVEYALPGTPELGGAVTECFRKGHDLVVMRNHGQMVAGKDYSDILQKAGFFELACQVLLTGRDLHPIAPDEAQFLKDHVYGRPRENG